MIPCQFFTPRVTVPGQMGLHLGQVDDPVRLQKRFEYLGLAVQPRPFYFDLDQFFLIKINDPVRAASFGGRAHARGFERGPGPAHVQAQRRIVSDPDLTGL